MDFKSEVAVLLAEAAGTPKDDILNTLEIPPNPDMGDYAYPCFKLAKAFRKAPPAIAAELAEKVRPADFLRRAEAAGPYVNFFLDKSFYAQAVLKEVLNLKEDYGRGNLGAGKNIVIDFSSPNIAKPFHVGHLRSTVIGNALCNIYKFLGYNCISINHLGDWGTQFGKLISAYKRWGDRAKVEAEGIKELTRIYVLFHEEAEKDPSLDDEARQYLVQMQNGDEEALSLWKWFNEISLADFNRIYAILNIRFDHFTGESFYNDKMAAVVSELREKNLLKESDGAMVVELEDYKMPPCLILRRDGGTLYPTRDIAAALYRKKEFDFEKCLIVTAFDQNLHFEQWFKVIKLMGYDFADALVHIPFGLVVLEEGKLATRKGRVVLMEDLLNEAVSKTKAIIEEKNPELLGKDEISKQVGIGAVIFNDLYNNRIKDVVFSWDRMLSFEGESGPYLQYTHARACSLLKKAGWNPEDAVGIDYSLISDEYSAAVIRNIDRFAEKIAEAAARNEPYIISRHIMELAQAFSKFYDKNHILGSEDVLRKARLAIVYAVKTVIASGLGLLGIAAPEEM